MIPRSKRLVRRVGLMCIRGATCTALLTAFTFLWPVTTSLAQDRCKAIEVAPGVRQLPKSCRQPSPRTAEPPAAQRRELHLGGTNLTVSGRVRTEYGFRR